MSEAHNADMSCFCPCIHTALAHHSATYVCVQARDEERSSSDDGDEDASAPGQEQMTPPPRHQPASALASSSAALKQSAHSSSQHVLLTPPQLPGGGDNAAAGRQGGLKHPRSTKEALETGRHTQGRDHANGQDFQPAPPSTPQSANTLVDEQLLTPPALPGAEANRPPTRPAFLASVQSGSQAAERVRVMQLLLQQLQSQQAAERHLARDRQAAERRVEVMQQQLQQLQYQQAAEGQLALVPPARADVCDGDVHVPPCQDMSGEPAEQSGLEHDPAPLTPGPLPQPPVPGQASGVRKKVREMVGGILAKALKQGERSRRSAKSVQMSQKHRNAEDMAPDDRVRCLPVAL